jgi:hypothetical protein
MMEEASARNCVLLLMVLLQNVHVFNCRSESTSAFRVPLHRNWILIFGVLAAQGIHIEHVALHDDSDHRTGFFFPVDDAGMCRFGGDGNLQMG